jgi:hypothetical protein
VEKQKEQDTHCSFLLGDEYDESFLNKARLATPPRAPFRLSLALRLRTV